ncbi:MAG TPA: LamG-like jellyroll fold domain-containing protein, partial [Candidatus Dormibacteraeota bacterium]|nr:LamG-like jellyroll fold domain-containing protein [Candidatus Dormibacteraeota bacterium]
LTSYGVQSTTNLGIVGGSDLFSTNSLQGGEAALYQFALPSGLNAAEVRLDSVTGLPFMTLQTSSNAVNCYDSYGNDGGVGYSLYSSTLITLPNPSSTNYSLTVQATPSGGVYPNAQFTVHVRQIQTPILAFDAALNGPGISNIVTGTLLDGQSAFYQLTVPTNLNGQPVIGWRLDVSQSSGSAKIRVRQGASPDGSPSTSPFVANEAIIVPPYLTPGTWFVEIRATGLTSYTLTSSNLQLKRPAWSMPVLGNQVTTTGLPPSGPLFGDTGVDTNGIALAGDQGTDLAQGSFDYYSVTVPPGNIGVLRTRLDAISGNPNLYIRVGGPSTLSHSSSGSFGSLLYDRSLSSSGGSEYGNWVPLNGRYEAYLTNATWYLAVQAGGNSNVRYRLRLFSGIVTNLALNGGSYTSQTIAAGDWLYYRVLIPTNAPVNWAVTFSEQLGNVVMYIRDRVPPGLGASISDYVDWSIDNKNHSSAYNIYDPPGTYTFTNPPLRPGNSYFIGFRAVNDATFSVSCNTNGGYIDYTNTVPFYAGAFNSTVAAHGVLKLRIDVPADARRLIMNFTNVSAFNLFVDQGAVPSQTTSDHFYSLGNPNPVLNQALYNAWPWQPNYMYFLLVTNTSGGPQNFTFGVNGQNCATDDADNDGLPDCWETTWWSSIFSYGPNDDPDGDGVKNIDEFLEGTDPTNPLSFHPRLQVTAANGVVNRNPAGTLTTNVPPKIWYNLGQVVQLTAVPNAGYSFLGWASNASGTLNPLSVTMNGHSNITAIFGVTNAPTADYQFQNNLHSSVGNPPDLTNIAPGNVFTTELVDGSPRTVYHFAQSSSVALLPANGVIPTNAYTVVMLFRFDGVSGWRRILDVKNPVSDYGLYALSGQLDFYPFGATGPTVFAASNYVQVVLTRDASSNVVCYLNGVQQVSFLDTGNYTTVDGVPQMLRFFKDNSSEDAGGAVARIRLYDKVMPPAQVASLDRLIAGPAPLQFVQPSFYSNHVMYLTLQVTPNFTYAIQASTNLINWTTFTNVTSATPLVLISDPQAPNFPRRFYRGVAQASNSSPVAQPALTNLTRPSANALSFTLVGTPGLAYTVETSSNLVNWIVRSNCTMNINGTFQFLETNTTNPPVRFYRARYP